VYSIGWPYTFFFFFLPHECPGKTTPRKANHCEREQRERERKRVEREREREQRRERESRERERERE
jgi:hypothetical protein